MPLFDPDSPVSEELAVAFKLADELAALATFQELAEEAVEADARAKIVVGVLPPPVDGVQFTPEELADRHLYVQIFRASGGHGVQSTGVMGERPREIGQLQINIRRFVRAIEDEQDVTLFFWDRISKIAVDLQTAWDARIGQLDTISEPEGPFRSAWKTELSTGEYLWAHMVANWGDGNNEQQ